MGASSKNRDRLLENREILLEYLDLIAEPTLADFQRNPQSLRHAFLACVATFHAVDRANYPGKPANFRDEWRKESPEFLIVDMIAHHFKHVQSDFEKAPAPKNDLIPLVDLVFGKPPKNMEALGLDLRNLYFVIRDAIYFIRSKANGSV